MRGDEVRWSDPLHWAFSVQSLHRKRLTCGLPLDFACKLLIIRCSACKVFLLNELAPEDIRGFACFFDLYSV